MNDKGKNGREGCETTLADPRNPRKGAKSGKKAAKRLAATKGRSAWTGPPGERERATVKDEDGRPVQVERRVDTIAAMQARRQIDQAQAWAAQRFAAAFGAVQGSASSPIARLLAPVRTAPSSCAPADAKLDAARLLAEARDALGATDMQLVVWVAGEGLTIAEAADRLAGVVAFATGQRWREYVGQRLRDALQTLAREWGYREPRRTSAGIVAQRVDPTPEERAAVVRGEVRPGRTAHATAGRVFVRDPVAEGLDNPSGQGAT